MTSSLFLESHFYFFAAVLPPILLPKMSDEWRKYKVIQEWQDKEFREVLAKEVSISLSSEDVKLQVSIGIITQTHTDFLISRQRLTPSWLVVTESFFFFQLSSYFILGFRSQHLRV